MRRALAFSLLAACSFFKGGSVLMSGRVMDGPGWDPHRLDWTADDTGGDDTGGDDTGGDDTGGARALRVQDGEETLSAVAGASLTVRDPEEQEFSAAETASDGSFSVGLPEGSFFTLVIQADGRVPTAFSGTAGVEDWAVDDGDLWVASTERLDALRAAFSACPAVNDAGGVLEGEVRLYIAGYEAEALPTVTTAKVSITQADGTALSACYLDDTGNSSSDAETTGASGRFAVFGVMEGPVVATVTYTVGAETSQAFYRFGWMPPDGLTPLYPFYVDLL